VSSTLTTSTEENMKKEDEASKQGSKTTEKGRRKGRAAKEAKGETRKREKRGEEDEGSRTKKGKEATKQWKGAKKEAVYGNRIRTRGREAVPKVAV
jgi:hypothetical protein